jgi:peptidoglycan hydrolase-like protein with peptidoglycan-binding domain
MTLTPEYIDPQGNRIPDYAENDYREMAKILVGLGYLADISEAKDEQLWQTAIKKFQTDHHCLPDGNYGPETQVALAKVMREIQKNLNILINAQIPDNQPFYGPKTRSNVSLFQEKYHLGGTLGIADEKVRTELVRQVNALTDQKPVDELNDVDLTRLAIYLGGEQWKQADEETVRVLLKQVGKTVNDSFDRGDIEKIPCSYFTKIDALWQTHSQGKFGLTVQRHLWEKIAATTTGQSNEEIATKLGEEIGHYREGNWIIYSETIFDLNTAPVGHLPVLWWRRGWVLVGIGDAIATMVQKLSDCDQ